MNLSLGMVGSCHAEARCRQHSQTLGAFSSHRGQWEAKEPSGFWKLKGMAVAFILRAAIARGACDAFAPKGSKEHGLGSVIGMESEIT